MKIKRFSQVMYRNHCQENSHGFRVTQIRTVEGQRLIHLEDKGWFRESTFMPREEWLARQVKD
jgi:hypothetical protein